jgi:choice-of-anchor C domain-containing protein
MRSRTILPILAAAACAHAPHAFAQNLLQNSSFEAPSAGSSFVTRGGDGLTGWNVTGNIDHIGGFWVASEGIQSVDLNGSAAGSVSQTIATIPGQHYRLRYALGENLFGFGNKTMDIVWQGNVVDSLTVIHDPARTAADMRWEQRELRLTASGSSATLTFASTTGAMNGTQGVAHFYGPAIDDIRLEPTTCPADFNNDGFINPDDLADFITCFFLDVQFPGFCPDADFNADGFRNPDDLADFITAFFTSVC